MNLVMSKSLFTIYSICCIPRPICALLYFIKIGFFSSPLSCICICLCLSPLYHHLHSYHFFLKIIWESTIYNPFIYLFILFPFSQITFSLFYCRCTSVKKLSIHYQHTFLHPFFILSTTIGVGGFASPVFVPGGEDLRL